MIDLVSIPVDFEAKPKDGVDWKVYYYSNYSTTSTHSKQYGSLYSSVSKDFTEQMKLMYKLRGMDLQYCATAERISE